MRAGSSVAEQPPLKRLVGGSTPPRPTIPKVMSDTLDRLAEQLYLAAGVSDIVWARTNPSVRAFYRRIARRALKQYGPAVAALLKLEWTYHDAALGQGSPRCPACGFYQFEGHRYDCTTAAALNAARLEDAIRT
jgi:hypothetical protein